MAKKTQEETKAQDLSKVTISVEQHNNIILMDRFNTFLQLSLNRSIQAGDPDSIVKAADFIINNGLVTVKFPQAPEPKPAESKEPEQAQEPEQLE